MKCLRVVCGLMNITVIRGKSKESIEMPDGSTPGDLCSLFGILIDAHIALRNNVPIPMDETIVEGDVIRIIKVASGG